MEEEVFLFAGNLEADVAEACPRNDGLLAFAARYCGPEFHRWPPNLVRPVLQGDSSHYLSSSLPAPRRQIRADGVCAKNTSTIRLSACVDQLYIDNHGALTDLRGKNSSR